LSPGDICVDIDANVGYDTLLASHLVGPHGSVIAIEASPSIFDLLSRNIGENDARNIRLVQKAVSARDVKLVCWSAKQSNNRGLTTTLASATYEIEATVDALPLDQILTVEERSRLLPIKLDIEGGEVPVMRRFLDTLELYPDFDPYRRSSAHGRMARHIPAYAIRRVFSLLYRKLLLPAVVHKAAA
jgi:FkbM family methyltransferase